MTCYVSDGMLKSTYSLILLSKLSLAQLQHRTFYCFVIPVFSVLPVIVIPVLPVIMQINDLLQYVPVLLENLLTFVEFNCETEGLYRLPGKTAAVDKLRQDLEQVTSIMCCF